MVDKRGHTQYIDYYNKQGKKYAQVILDANSQRRILKRYFNHANEEFMVENFVTNDIMLFWNDKEYFFHSKIQFVKFYLNVTQVETEDFLINSFLVPAAVLNGLPNSGNDSIFWQGDITNDIIKHMENVLEKGKKSYKIIIPSQSAYQNVIDLIDEKYHNRIFQSGYVYKFVKSNNYTNKVLTLTNSDQLPHLEKMVQDYPNIFFHVAAKTEMSMKLLHLNKYSNVNLYPNAKREKFISLYKQCDIYLDINKGSEILDAVRAAFDYNLLILGYNTTAHNKDVTSDANLFDEAIPETLSNTLKQVIEDKSNLEDRLQLQLQQAGSISKDEFITSLNH